MQPEKSLLNVRRSILINATATNVWRMFETFDATQNLTFENDWIPNRGWIAPTYITLRLSPVLDGTLVELLHHGMERTGGDVAATHASYEQGWGMTQLNALKRLYEEAD